MQAAYTGRQRAQPVGLQRERAQAGEAGEAARQLREGVPVQRQLLQAACAGSPSLRPPW